jgi:hypothetical protein
VLGVNYYGVKFGVVIIGVKFFLPRKRHVYVDANVGKDFDAKCAGAKTCNLGANNDGAKLRVYFLKSFWQRCICENLSKKG